MFSLTLTRRATAPCSAPTRATLWAGITQMAMLWRSRRDLAGLTEAQLQDIGVTSEQAAREAKRPVWDAPAHWKG